MTEIRCGIERLRDADFVRRKARTGVPELVGHDIEVAVAIDVKDGDTF
jgi:hypothetical protein